MKSRGRHISIPGFTADRSLYTCTLPYRGAAMRFLSEEANVQPQMSDQKYCLQLEKGIMGWAPLLAWDVATHNWSDYYLDHVPRFQRLLTAYGDADCGRFRRQR